MTGVQRSLVAPAAIGSVVAASTALSSVYERPDWFWPCVGATLAAFLVGALTRRLDVPTVLAPAVSLLGLLVLLGAVWYRDTLAFGVPTSATVHEIGLTLRDASRAIREQAAPVLPVRNLLIITVGGAYLVASLVDLIAVRGRRAAVAGFPLLAFYLVPTSMARSVSVAPFVIGAAGYVTLLVAEGRDRARAWGRRLIGVDGRDEVADVRPVARVGRRLGAAALGVALVVPAFVPSVGDGFLGADGAGLAGGGSSVKQVVNPIVGVQARLRDRTTTTLLTVRTDRPDYLRFTALSEFDGLQWTLAAQQAGDKQRVGAKRTIPTPVEFASVPTTSATYDVAMADLDIEWLPAPYAPRRVRVKGDWRYDARTLAVFSSKSTSRRLSYVVESLIAEPTSAQLDRDFAYTDKALEPYLRVPARTPNAVVDVLRKVVNPSWTPFTKAVALQEFFRRDGNFVYDLDVARGTSIGDISTFLRVRRGYCEQFATTFAYLARLAGIPARVAVGFTPGQRQADGSYRVTNHDAHAWPELYFPVAGWLRFEPTPRDTLTSLPNYAPQTSTTAPQPGASPSAAPTAAPSASPNIREPLERDGAPTPPLAALARTASPSWPVGLGLALLLLLLAVPSALRAVLTRWRWSHSPGDSTRVHAAWEMLLDAAEDVGLTAELSETPRATAYRLMHDAPLYGADVTGVQRLAALEERARYAAALPPVADDLPALTRALRRALRDVLPRGRRWRVAAFPPSALRRLADAARAATAAIETAPRRAWVHLRPRQAQG